MFPLNRIFKMDVARNIYLCLTGAGVIVFIFYCMRINFFPTGLTISDAIFFLMVIAPFALLLIFILVLWYSMSVLISYAVIHCMMLIFRMARKRIPSAIKGTYKIGKSLKIYHLIPVHILMSGIGGLVIYTVVESSGDDLQLILLSIFITAIFITLIPNAYFDKRIEKDNKKKHSIIIAVSALTLFFVISDMTSIINDAGMRLIGVRRNNVNILLQEDDLHMVRYLTGEPEQNFFKGDALFTGVGTTSLLLINNKKVIVKNENLTLSF